MPSGRHRCLRAARGALPAGSTRSTTTSCSHRCSPPPSSWPSLPALLVAVFGHSEKATWEWLTGGFDIDIEILNLMLSGQMAATRFGAYLRSLQTRFPGTVVADMLCLPRVQLELSIRAKGMLMAREAGLPLPSPGTR